MSKDQDFLVNKKNNLKKLTEAKKQKKVDEEIINLLDLINSSENYFTTSSCAGRIVLLEIPEIGDKKNAKFLGKWHRQINLDELLDASKTASKGYIWLLAQSPIIHIASRTLSDAEEILKIGVSCGFKNSGIKSLGKNIIVEICSTERLDSPVGLNGNMFFNERYSELLIEIVNNVIEKSNKKLKKLEELLNDKIQ